MFPVLDTNLCMVCSSKYSYILFRANLIGACLGAKFGIQGIPEDWMSKVDGMDGIIKNAITCFS